MFRPLLVLFGLTFSATPGFGHEFWIDPEEHAIEVGEKIVAAIRVGEAYEGTSYSYLPRRFERFEAWQDGDAVPVPGRIGDRPALVMEPLDDGLVTLVHETKNSTLTYREFAKFIRFVEHKDAQDVVARHQANGWPETDFKEVYSRYAKSLVAIGSGKGEDVEVGLLTEIVALENPYLDDMSDGLDVRLLYQGQPRSVAQIEIFAKSPEGDVAISTVTTDASGRATIPVEAGYRYMLDAVVLREATGVAQEESGALWESLWANLTFEIPR